MHIPVLNRSMVVLNSLSAVRELMERRSAIYSCRPRMVLISELYVVPVRLKDDAALTL